MTDAEYVVWLSNPSSIRLVLIEVVVNIAGVETTRYLSTGGYVTGAADTPANTAYLPVVSSGIQFTEQISLTSGASLSAGDIVISNPSGERDNWLLDVWVNRPIQAFIGDPRWARSDFRMIFNGIVADIDSKGRDVLNLMLRDKMQRLNTPLSDTKLGGTTPNKDVIIPLLFGECHNITPLLSNPVTLEYQIHGGPVESIFEVRDNGKPIAVTTHNDTGKFELLSSPAGIITVSAQGDKPVTYYNTISKLVQRIVTGYGKASDRFVTDDLDIASLDAFDAAHPQPVGIYSDGRENVLNVCEQLAASVGAQLIMTRAGKLRILQINLPAVGTPVVITASQMMERSLRVSSRSSVASAVKLGFVKNWTVQPTLFTSLPALHKEMYATEWWTATITDTAVQDKYKLNVDPVQIDTMLLRRVDAEPEASRQLDMAKVPLTVYEFEATADLMTLELGQAVTLVNARFGMINGVMGMVISLSPDWMTGRVTVAVLSGNVVATPWQDFTPIIDDTVAPPPVITGATYRTTQLTTEVLRTSAVGYIRTSQVVAEVLTSFGSAAIPTQPDPSITVAKVTQLAAEVLRLHSPGDLQTFQLVVEVVTSAGSASIPTQPDPSITASKITQLAVEVLSSPATGSVQTNQLVVETLTMPDDALVQVSQLAVEVLRHS